MLFSPHAIKINENQYLVMLGDPYSISPRIPSGKLWVGVQGSPLVPARLFGVGSQFAQVHPKLAQVESEFGSNLPKFIHPMAQVDTKLAQICPSSPQPAAATSK